MDRRSLRDLDILTLQLFVAICEEGTRFCDIPEGCWRTSKASASN